MPKSIERIIVREVKEFDNKDGVQLMSAKTTTGKAQYGAYVKLKDLRKIIPFGVKTKAQVKKRGKDLYKKMQGYNARMDESLGMRRGASSTKKQSLKSRRDEAKGMNKASGKRAYSSVRSMDKIKYYDDSQMKRLLKTNSRDWESIALKKGYDVDMRNYKWFKKK